jgi:hypothetical protein
MRFLLFVIASCVAMLLLATSCSSPKHASIRYSPPSAHSVYEKLSDAENLARAEASAAGAAKAAIARATSLVAAPADQLSVPELKEALGDASGQVESLLTANASLQAALKEVGAKLAVYETATKLQTTLLNSANDRADAAEIRADKAERGYHRLKFYNCLIIAAGVGLLAWRFKSLLLFIPAPWNLVAMGALPVGAFGLAWILL